LASVSQIQHRLPLGRPLALLGSTLQHTCGAMDGAAGMITWQAGHGLSAI
jgi:hypothetical protein